MSAPVLERSSPTAFDMSAYLARYDARALETSAEYRKAVTYASPLMFALVYLPHLVSGEDTGNRITFSQFHLDLFENGKRWMCPLGRPRQFRDCYVAPRNAGKSTILFTILPLWAAAHGHVGFIAAFADTADQAEGHLRTFKMELDGNKWLQQDFPELCAPARRAAGQTFGDSQNEYVAQSGFAFFVRGVETAVLGMKLGERRPDLLLLDDIEPQEGKYSAALKVKRLKTLVGAIFRLRITARVVITGTTTMFGSIIHDLVRTVTEPDPPESWPAQQNITVHYYPAIVTRDDGTEESWWPEFMSIEELQAERHTADFKTQMMNQPTGGEGAYWLEEDFRYGMPLGVTKTLLAIDPSISNDRKRQDYTGLAVVAWSPSEQKCVVRHAEGVKLTGKRLRERVLKLLVMFPEIQRVLVETNQGGELWDDALHDLPGVRLVTSKATEKKEDRFARALNHWQRARVLHEKRVLPFEEQALSYPNVMNDDIIDATVAGVSYFLDVKPRPKSSIRVSSYI